MAGTRGYRNYRGRTPRWKIVLAVLLVIIIAAAAGVILMQRYVEFDSFGTPKLELPKEEGKKDPAPPEDDVKINIQEPEGPAAVSAFTLVTSPMTQESCTAARTAIAAQFGKDKGYGVVVPMKRGPGEVFYASATAVPSAVHTAPDTAAAMQSLLKGDKAASYAIAQVSCLRDSYAAYQDARAQGLMKTNGYLFKDAHSENWLDPSKPAAAAYLTAIVKECAAMGFDEILLTDLCFPDTGKLNAVAYPEAGKPASISACLTALRTALDTAGYKDVLLSVEVPAELIQTGTDEVRGLVLADLAKLADKLYAPAAPEAVAAMEKTVDALEGDAVFVPRLAAYSAKPAGKHGCIIG